MLFRYFQGEKAMSSKKEEERAYCICGMLVAPFDPEKMTEGGKVYHKRCWKQWDKTKGLDSVYGKRKEVKATVRVFNVVPKS